ncbi:threonine--tRNA ligase [Longispora albida]|uniref:threonine--tRNA ligase n=1 Tax=Longispora albida TaxID=203523 RepID=UPI000377241C|nr:threonine--tRNA ligase [Longispora albida]
MSLHADLGRELGIFDSHPLAGAGLPIWLPEGAAVRLSVEDYLRRAERAAGYQHVYSPPIGKRELYEISGHWQHFAEDMFPVMDGEVLRPSLCPHHAIVFGLRGRSYRELPLRIAEIGQQFRAERSGVVGGLSRVRCMNLNDAHIFCSPDQIAAEVGAVLDLIIAAYEHLGISGHRFRLSLRGAPDDPKYAAGAAMWDRAENHLRNALLDRQSGFEEMPGEAAFYGPKIDVQVPDAAGKEWTLSTVQLDFCKPGRFALRYRGADGQSHEPVMIHRSIAGSMERLVALMLEQNQGAFPAWCAPVQLAVLPVGDVPVDGLLSPDLRSVVLSEGSLGSRVREAISRKIPFAAVVGEREARAGEVSLRVRGSSEARVLPLAEARALIARECQPPH